MDVAIRGDRASCLTLQLGSRTWLFAVAHGFGAIDGVPIAPAALERLRTECERRARSERFRRAIDRPQSAAAALLGALARVNGDIFVRSAAHDDYVSVGCSFSALLVVRGHAYVVHAGRTAVYLAHGGDVVALTSDDGFGEARLPLLLRALGTSSALDVAVSSVIFEPGDIVILAAERMRGEISRLALIAHAEAAGSAEQLLVVRFDDSDRSDAATPVLDAAHFGSGLRATIRVLATIAGTLAYMFTIGWAR